MRRFFAGSSFWNQPVGRNPAIDPRSDQLVQFMASHDNRGFWINLHRFTIPIYEVDANTPRRKVFRMFESEIDIGMVQRSAEYLEPGHPLGHEMHFAADAASGHIPIPDDVSADPASDAHLALIDWNSGWAWDMWKAQRRADGQWESRSGIKYRIDGSGVFDRTRFDVHNGESIHLYGPGRASGVPILAGTIMYDEIASGRIEHKLGFATRSAAFQQFVSPPACWTDGGWQEGLPEGAVLQLDPDLDLATLPLTPPAMVVAEALQEYGAVCIDVAGGHSLYGQGLYADKQGRSWADVLDEDAVIHIGLEHFRVLHMKTLIAEGMGRRVSDGVYA